MGTRRLEKNFILLLGIWVLFSTSVVTVVTMGNATARAVIGMAWGLLILWVMVCGGLMYRFREPLRNWMENIRLQWQIKFVILAVALALLEEAIATAMTNLAPLFGVAVGSAYITASTNFFDVIFFHSVINFAGLFVFWALALKWYDLKPFPSFLIFGMTGVFAEASLGGPQAFLEFGFWIFVYGLMLFLPVYTLPPAAERGARPAKFYHYILMIFLPYLFVPLFAWIPKVIDPHHPQPTHFGPIR